VAGSCTRRRTGGAGGPSRGAGHGGDALQHRLDQQAVHAAALLLLAEEGGSRSTIAWPSGFPSCTRANEISIRQLLSMTSGYQDYWPQGLRHARHAEGHHAAAILKGWAQKPLDFEPGTRWQYSNTELRHRGQIVERVAGQPLLAFLRPASSRR
jgi:CubicO group peptidase (beta-lactamase class C family)